MVNDTALIPNFGKTYQRIQIRKGHTNTIHTYTYIHIYIYIYAYTAASSIGMFHPDPARKLSANLYDIYHCSVYSETLLMMDRGTVRNM